MTANPTPVVPPTETAPLLDPYVETERGLATAYSDCHSHHQGPYIPARNLNFCAPVTLSVKEARRLLTRYVPSLNAFQPALLKVLPQDCRVRLAREYSVCLYVEVKEMLDAGRMRRELRCDEVHLCQVLDGVRTYRLWWD